VCVCSGELFYSFHCMFHLAFKIIIFGVFQNVNCFTYQLESFQCLEKQSELFHLALKKCDFQCFQKVNRFTFRSKSCHSYFLQLFFNFIFSHVSNTYISETPRLFSKHEIFTITSLKPSSSTFYSLQTLIF